jgi:hypothetical protein
MIDKISQNIGWATHFGPFLQTADDFFTNAFGHPFAFIHQG